MTGYTLNLYAHLAEDPHRIMFTATTPELDLTPDGWTVCDDDRLVVLVTDADYVAVTVTEIPRPEIGVLSLPEFRAPRGPIQFGTRYITINNPKPEPAVDQIVDARERTPARPGWAGALVVRDKDALLHLADADRGGFNCQNGTHWPIRDMGSLEPITVVIDADGNTVCNHALPVPPGALLADEAFWPAYYALQQSTDEPFSERLRRCFRVAIEHATGEKL